MDDKWQAYFGSRHWRVAEEYTGVSSGVTFRKGKFEVPPDKRDRTYAFESPLSTNKGKRGVLLQEVDEQGQDIPGSLEVFGEGAVKRARDEFKAIW